MMANEKTRVSENKRKKANDGETLTRYIMRVNM